MSKPFADLITDQPAIRLVVNGITDAVAMSYVSHPMRQGATGKENKRRTQICVKLVRLMKGDLKWSVQRCVDELPAALQIELSGQRWQPPARDSWFATGQI